MIHPDLNGVRTLIFDLDGTLIRSEDTAKLSLRGALDDFYSLMGLTAPEFSDADLMKGVGAPSNQFYKSLLPDKYQKDWKKYREFVFKHEKRLFYSKRITFSGIIKTLKELRKRGYHLTLVSNCNRSYLETVLESQNLKKYFNPAYCISDFGGTTKQALVKKILDEYGRNAAVFGDRIYDVEAAQSNNIPAVGALYGYGTREELAGTVTWIEDNSDLLYLFDPFRELVENIAHLINQRRKNHRPMIAVVSSAHSSQSHEFVNAVLTTLSELNVPSTHISLDRYRNDNALDGNHDLFSKIQKMYPWNVIQKEIFEKVKNGKIEFELVDNCDTTRTYRARPGHVVLVEGPFILAKSLAQNIDFGCWINSTDVATGRAIKKMFGKYKTDSRLSHLEVQYPWLNNSCDQEFHNWERKQAKLQRFFLEENKPSSFADVIIEGNRIYKGQFRQLRHN
ncbi:MAG: HAD family hydrolase [Candidatus Electryonea clarkiae]|nr:HAD family hydrolase [Candidatus Electryonea clarkiae]MDP8285820.1 HAD family hydrolase [Candidatus Electryonea clarkiae]